MMSIERSGVRTWTAPRTSSQYVATVSQGCLVVGRSPAPDELGRGSRPRPPRRAGRRPGSAPRRRARSSSAARRTGPARARRLPGAGVRGRGRPGGPGAPLRPRNSVRSAVHAVCRPPRSRNATRPPNSVFHGLRARSARSPGSSSVTIRRAAAPRERPEHPLGVGGHRQPPGAARIGSRWSARDTFTGVVERHELDQVEVDAVVRRARTGCSRRRGGRRRSTPRSGSAAPSGPTAHRCRRRGRRSPRRPGR